MKNKSDQIEEAVKKLPLLAEDEADETESPLRTDDAQEDDFEDDGDDDSLDRANVIH